MIETPPLTGDVALVTGAGRGLGRAIASALAAAGAHVVLGGRDPAPLRHAVDEIVATGGSASASCFDLADVAATERAMRSIADDLGGLDVLVNNVGVRDRRPLSEFTRDDVRRVLDVNVVAPLALAQLAAEQMRRRGGGRIVNITSIAGDIARAGDAAYTASKGALTALTRALAAELGPDRITVNAVAPGYFATEANAEMVADPAVAEWLSRRTSLGRWGEPAEIAGAVVFLASPAASYVTGQVLAVDGGYSAHF